MRDNRLRVFLEVIGRQHVVCDGHEGFEVAPGSARYQPQCRGLGARDRQMTGDWRGGADPGGDGGRGQPQQHERRGHPSGRRVQAGDQYGRGARERDGAPHVPIGAGRAQTRGEVRLRGRHPLQQVAPAHTQAKQSPSDRIEHQPCLMRQECNQQHGLSGGQPDIIAQRPQMTAQINASAPRQDRWADHEQGRQRDDGNDETAPDQRRTVRQHPACQQCGQCGRCR